MVVQNISHYYSLFILTRVLSPNICHLGLSEIIWNSIGALLVHSDDAFHAGLYDVIDVDSVSVDYEEGNVSYARLEAVNNGHDTFVAAPFGP